MVDGDLVAQQRIDPVRHLATLMGEERPLLSKRDLEGAVRQPSVPSNPCVSLKAGLQNRIFSHRPCPLERNLGCLDNQRWYPLSTRVLEHRDRRLLSMLSLGQKAPDFSLKALVGKGDFADVSLSDYRGKWVVLFFYPLDFTSVCPTEINEFSK